jgi:hypothetical protein
VHHLYRHQVADLPCASTDPADQKHLLPGELHRVDLEQRYEERNKRNGDEGAAIPLIATGDSERNERA